MQRDSLQLLIGTFDIIWDFLVSFGTLEVMFRDYSSIFWDFQAIFWDVMLLSGMQHCLV